MRAAGNWELAAGSCSAIGGMTHASTAGSQLEVPDNLVRLSVGIEDVADLLGDIEQALAAST